MILITLDGILWLTYIEGSSEYLNLMYPGIYKGGPTSCGEIFNYNS